MWFGLFWYRESAGEPEWKSRLCVSSSIRGNYSPGGGRPGRMCLLVCEPTSGSDRSSDVAAERCPMGPDARASPSDPARPHPACLPCSRGALGACEPNAAEREPAWSCAIMPPRVPRGIWKHAASCSIMQLAAGSWQTALGGQPWPCVAIPRGRLRTGGHLVPPVPIVARGALDPPHLTAECTAGARTGWRGAAAGRSSTKAPESAQFRLSSGEGSGHQGPCWDAGAVYALPLGSGGNGCWLAAGLAARQAGGSTDWWSGGGRRQGCLQCRPSHLSREALQAGCRPQPCQAGRPAPHGSGDAAAVPCRAVPRRCEHAGTAAASARGAAEAKLYTAGLGLWVEPRRHAQRPGRGQPLMGHRDDRRATRMRHRCR